MGRELIFYPAFRDKKTGKVRSALTDANGKPASVFWRSQSFIDMDWFTEQLPMLGNDEFDDSCKEYFAHHYDGLLGEGAETPSYVYCLSESTLYNVGKSHGVVDGYVPIEDLKAFYTAEYPQEYLYWQMPTPIPAEAFLELPDDEKGKYGRLYTVNTYSKEYVCSVLAEIVDDFDIPWEWEGDRCFIVSYSF